MALSTQDLKMLREIAKRAVKEPAFRERLRKDLKGVLKEYRLSASISDVRKALSEGHAGGELSDSELSAVAAGFSIDHIFRDVGRDIKSAADDAGDAIKHGAEAIAKPVEDLGKGAWDMAKDAGTGVYDSGKDLFKGDIGGAAKALVNVPVATGKDAVEAVTKSAEDLGTNVVQAAAKTLEAGVEISPVSLSLSAVGLGGVSKKIDGFIGGDLIGGTASGLDKGITAVGNLTRDVADTGIDVANLPYTASAQMFDDATKGKWKAALADPLTAPLSTLGKDGKQIFSDATSPSTLEGLLAIAGVAAIPFTGGASAALFGAEGTAEVGGEAAAEGLLGKATTAVKGGFQGVADAAKGAAQAAGNLAKNIPGAQSLYDYAASWMPDAAKVGTKVADAGGAAAKVAPQIDAETQTAAKELEEEAARLEKANPKDPKVAQMRDAAKELRGEKASAQTVKSMESKPIARSEAEAAAKEAPKAEEAAAKGRLDKLKAFATSKKGMALIGGGVLSSGGALLPLLFGAFKGSAPATGATATADVTPASTSDAQSSPYTQGLGAIVATLQDPRMAQLATVIDQKAGNTNLTQNLQTLMQNAAGVLQNPSDANVAQIQQQLAQIFQSLQATQGQTPDAATQQMEQVLAALFEAISQQIGAGAASA